MRSKEFYVPGVIIAGLAGIVPALGGNCCCCGVVTAALGLLAVYLVRRKSGGIPIEAGEGALIGLLSGGVTALLAVAWTIVTGVLAGPALAHFRSQIAGSQDFNFNLATGPAGIVIQCILCIVIHAGGGALGGLIAVPTLKTGTGGGVASESRGADR